MIQPDRQLSEISGTAPEPVTSGPGRRRRREGLPWLGLVIAFLVVLVLAAVVYLARETIPAPSLVEMTPTRAAVQRPATVEYVPFTPMPIPQVPTATVASTTLQLEMTVGGRAEVVNSGVNGVRFRTGPGLGYTTLGIIFNGGNYTVLEGPRDVDGYRWWRLQDDTGATGWVAENWLRPIGP